MAINKTIYLSILALISAVSCSKPNIQYNKRSIYYIEHFKDHPYKASPTSERKIYNLDGFDCVTFVDSVLAFSKAENYEDFISTIKELGYYDSIVKFQQRRHFAIADHFSQQPQYFKNITDSITNKPLTTRTVEINRSAFFEKVFKKKNIKVKPEILRMSYAAFPSYDENYIKQKFMNKIFIIGFLPSQQKLQAIRTAIASDVDISHLGFMVVRNDAVYLYHAKLGDKVVEVKLKDYIEEKIKSDAFDGFMVYDIFDNI